MTPQVINTCAPGKLVVLGEYVVLRGAEAVVMAVDRYAKVQWTPVARPRGHLSVTAKELGLHKVPVTVSGLDVVVPDPFVDALRVVTEVLRDAACDSTLAAADINIDTSAFFLGEQKLGLGSSAAVSVALSRALLLACNIKGNQQTLFEHCFALHKRAQGGIGSGIDVAASVYGGLTSYRVGATPRVMTLPSQLGMFAVWGGASASTPHLVRRMMAVVDKKTDPITTLFANMHTCTKQGRMALVANDVPLFLQSVNAFYQLLKSFGDAASTELVTPQHAAIQRVVMEHGCAYKPSGAGGGDLGLAFGPRGKLSKVRASVVAAGFCVVPVKPAM